LAYWRNRFKVSTKRKPSIAAELSLRGNHFVDAGPLLMEIPDSKKPDISGAVGGLQLRLDLDGGVVLQISRL